MVVGRLQIGVAALVGVAVDVDGRAGQVGVSRTLDVATVRERELHFSDGRGDGGGTHHSAFSYDITEEYWEDFAEMTGIEYVRINKDTTTANFKQQLKNNEIYYMLSKALK